MRQRDRLGENERRRFGERLKELRGPMTLKALGAAAGLSASFISDLEGGESDPSLGTLLRLQRGLNLQSIEELLGPRPDMPSVAIGQRLAPGSEATAEAS
jgi:transcriptional regulator with XRE-family HTH domain